MSVYEMIYKVMVAVPGGTGEMQQQVKDIIRGTKSHNRQIVLAYPPKVGGTFMRTALINLLNENYQGYLSRGSYANLDHSRDLYFPTILNQHIVQNSRPAAAVMHLHMYPSRHVTEIIEAFDIPVIIATRDILDTLISGINMTEGMEDSDVFIDDSIVSNGKPYREMTPDERRYSVVHNVPLWYARFYAQWLRYDRECQVQGKRPPLWLHYDELKDEPQTVLARMARHVDPANHYSEEQISKALALSLMNKPAVRFNKGVSGRGQNYFTREEQQTIFDIVSKAGVEDLRRLGVLSSEAQPTAAKEKASA
ncbi:MAG: hypothetical protein QM647_19105 [Asticcacaulis sp.]|uniref:hypothetical protein n=1 Tax=Asticcacaulis sp. TaxID=1872648 RepID=UPI0039E3AF9B